MRNNRAVGTWIGLLLLFAGCAASGLETNKTGGGPTPDSPIAERPPLTPGDSWTYQRSNGWLWTRTFLRQENGLLVFQVGRSRTVFTNPDLAEVRVIDSARGELPSEEVDPIMTRCLKFPLRVGQRHSFNFEVWGRYVAHMVRIDVQCTVAAYETVTVKAGTFPAYRIIKAWEARSYTDSGQDTFWYAPAVKHVVRYEFTSGPQELVEYHIH